METKIQLDLTKLKSTIRTLKASIPEFDTELFLADLGLMFCWSCDQTSREYEQNIVVKSSIIDDSQYCGECKNDTQELINNSTKYAYFIKYTDEDRDDIIKSFSTHYWQQNVVHATCRDKLSTLKHGDISFTVLFEDHLGDNLTMYCPFDGVKIPFNDMYNVFFENTDSSGLSTKERIFEEQKNKVLEALRDNTTTNILSRIMVRSDLSVEIVQDALNRLIEEELVMRLHLGTTTYEKVKKPEKSDLTSESC